MYCPLNITQHITIIVQITGNKNEYTLSEHVKLCPKCQYFVGAPFLSSTALILLGMEFTRAAHLVAGVLFHSSLMTSRSCWMLDTWCFCTFCLRMPHMCSKGFRSGQIPGHSITFPFSSKAVVILAVCLGWLLCWKIISEGRASSSASKCHSTCWNPCFPQWTAAPLYQRQSCSPRSWCYHHHAWL